MTADFSSTPDCALIATDQSWYDWNRIACHGPLIVDNRDAVKGVSAPQATIVPAWGRRIRTGAQLRTAAEIVVSHE